MATPPKSAFESFIDKVSQKLKDLTTLTISTVIQDEKFEYSHNDNKIVEAKTGNTQVDGMVSEIQLVDGDISTKMTRNFLDNHSDLKDFHQAKEEQGQEIVRKNIELIKTIATTLKEWNK